MNHEIFEEMWVEFSQNEGKASPHSHYIKNHRMNAFAQNIEAIIEHNSNAEKTWTKGINKFSDMTQKEFKEYYKIKSFGEDQHCSATNERETVERTKGHHLPPNWDWRMHHGVTPVKNQGSCGSCWTFSTVGSLEAHELIKYKTWSNLSEQQLVDCAGDFDNHGCDGGLPSHAFEYISVQSHGLSLDKDYPYTAKDGNCTANPKDFALTVVGGSVNITEGDEDELAEAVFHHGPVSVAFEVVDDFSAYKSGVYSSTVCKNTTNDVNHAVVAVGYGTEDSVPYWIVKNSWGADWGDHGYFKIKRGVNMCGIAVCNSFPRDVQRLHHSSPFLQ